MPKFKENLKEVYTYTSPRSNECLTGLRTEVPELGEHPQKSQGAWNIQTRFIHFTLPSLL